MAPVLRENEVLFGVCHLFASFNDTFIHVTDLSGRETLVRRTGGMEVKADRDESSPYAAMMAAQKVAERLKDLGVSAIHIKLRATGGNTTKTPGPGMLRARSSIAGSSALFRPEFSRIYMLTPPPLFASYCQAHNLQCARSLAPASRSAALKTLRPSRPTRRGRRVESVEGGCRTCSPTSFFFCERCRLL